MQILLPCKPDKKNPSIRFLLYHGHEHNDEKYIDDW